MERFRSGISSFVLKWIAVITMIIDHVGAVLYPQYIVLRIIGRISFPIFCFLLVEGAMHTRNIRKYEIRLFLFALLSEIPFDLAFYGEMTMKHQNVFFTLFAGLVMIDILEHEKNSVYGMIIVLVIMLLTEGMAADYGAGGILFIWCFYIMYQRRVLKQVAFAAFNWLYFGMGVQLYAGFAALPMLLYNGKQGHSLKYVFYLFYPVHLLILYLIIRL